MSEENSQRRTPMTTSTDGSGENFRRWRCVGLNRVKDLEEGSLAETKSPASGGKQGGVKSLIDAALGVLLPVPASRWLHAFGGMPTFARVSACTCLDHRLLEALDVSGKSAA